LKNFLHSAGPFGPLHLKKFQETLILAFEANSALPRENETKIVKITHSEWEEQHFSISKNTHENGIK